MPVRAAHEYEGLWQEALRHGERDRGQHRLQNFLLRWSALLTIRRRGGEAWQPAEPQAEQRATRHAGDEGRPKTPERKAEELCFCTYANDLLVLR